MGHSAKLNEYALVPAAARICGVPRSTLISAIARGEVTEYQLNDGTACLKLTEVDRWKADKKRRKPGRPAKAR